MCSTTGGLDIAPRDSAIPLDSYTQAMDAEQVPYERLDAREIMRRWPQFTLPEECHGLYQAESGIAMAARANAAHQRMAREHGATLRDRTPVTAIRSVGGEVEVVADGKAYRCRRLTIAAGPWSNTALGWLGIHLPLEITREQVMYYKSPQREQFAPGRFPVWIWMDDPCFYGFPVFGEDAVKIAQDTGGQTVTAETRDYEEDPANRARVEGWARQYLPSALGPLLYTKTCLYTLTPDRDFVLDTIPEHPGISIAIGAGHAFKFASVIGQILSELAMDGQDTERPVSLYTGPADSAGEEPGSIVYGLDPQICPQIHPQITQITQINLRNLRNLRRLRNLRESAVNLWITLTPGRPLESLVRITPAHPANRPPPGGRATRRPVRADRRRCRPADRLDRTGHHQLQ